ncbi:beta-lactamase regulator AmpE [Corallincola luteus]|uniref:Beta-lactamase regulator AmpE n=1 Tax=Corallincola luteus TaxID=1775177 RepID=A0ABY2APC6_9GAMM|nr:beta-lactamase regulator AmpE [Corallincola luteus]TCI03606.1 beta-lactamase regulator AmpE [Corallincola luteus]
MVLFCLLLAIFLERVLHLGPQWQFHWYMQHYMDRTGQVSALAKLKDSFAGTLVVIALPAFAVLVWLRLVEGMLFGLVTLMSWMVILLVCFGCGFYRRQYKSYLKASCRGDEQACFEFAKVIEHTVNEQDHRSLPASLGQRLAWINYRYYGALICWVVLLGPAGAVFYCGCRYYLAQSDNEHSGDAELADVPVDDNAGEEVVELETVVAPSDAQRSIAHLMHWMDWLPVRVVTLGMALVGHFNRAFPIWLEHLLDMKLSAREFVYKVGDSTRDMDASSAVCVAEATHMVSLVKRNIVMMLAMISVLTLYGWLS